MDHFVGFERETRTMPVVWHQSLLTFVQRYKNEIRGEDREALRRLIGTQYHYQISPEVSRELDASRCCSAVSTRSACRSEGDASTAASRYLQSCRLDDGALCKLWNTRLCMPRRVGVMQLSSHDACAVVLAWSLGACAAQRILEAPNMCCSSGSASSAGCMHHTDDVLETRRCGPAWCVDRCGMQVQGREA